MNTSRFYLFLVFYALAFAQDDQIIKYEDLFDRNGLMYAPDQDTSFTGNVKDVWASGINKLEYNYVDGKPDAKWKLSLEKIKEYQEKIEKETKNHKTNIQVINNSNFIVVRGNTTHKTPINLSKLFISILDFNSFINS